MLWKTILQCTLAVLLFTNQNLCCDTVLTGTYVKFCLASTCSPGLGKIAKIISEDIACF